MTFVLRVCDGLQEFAVAPRTADVLGRAAASSFDEPRIDDTGAARCDCFQQHHAAPVVAGGVDSNLVIAVDMLEFSRRGFSHQSYSMIVGRTDDSRPPSQENLNMRSEQPGGRD